MATTRNNNPRDPVQRVVNSVADAAMSREARPAASPHIHEDEDAIDRALLRPRQREKTYPLDVLRKYLN